MTATSQRHYCRNRRCRTKMAVPVDNHCHAFCSKYCFDQFYQWRCKVCEEPILKGRRRKSPEHCRKPRCRVEFRRYIETFSYPSSRTVNLGSGSAHFTGVFSRDNSTPPVCFDTRPMPWRWDDLIIPGEHWLYDAH